MLFAIPLDFFSLCAFVLISTCPCAGVLPVRSAPCAGVLDSVAVRGFLPLVVTFFTSLWLYKNSFTFSFFVCVKLFA